MIYSPIYNYNLQSDLQLEFKARINNYNNS